MTDYGNKYATARQQVLAALLSMEWIGWRYLQWAGGTRYGARLRELKRLGYKIESVTVNDEHDKHGKRYRLISPEPGEPDMKQVKIYLPEDYVIELLADNTLYPEAKEIVAEALRIFQANRHKL